MDTHTLVGVVSTASDVDALLGIAALDVLLVGLANYRIVVVVAVVVPPVVVVPLVVIVVGVAVIVAGEVVQEIREAFGSLLLVTLIRIVSKTIVVIVVLRQGRKG